MKLYHAFPSPFARLARIMLREYDLLDRVEEVRRLPFDDDADFLAANPLGRIPALVLDDGCLVAESLLIIDYFAELAGKPVPEFEARRRCSYILGLMELVVARRTERERDESLYSEFWIGRRERGIDRTVRYLDTLEWDDAMSDGFAGIAMAAALDYLDLRYEDYDWRANSQNLEALQARWAQTGSFQATLGELWDAKK